MEMIDVLNEDGSQNGSVVSKKEVHEKGLWHRAAHVWFVNNKNEILLQKRQKNIESHPDKWDISAAGHLSAGDTKLQGALREVEEELSVELEEKDLIRIGEVRNESTQHEGKYINKEYVDIYVVCKDLPINDFVIQESEVSEVRYIPLGELKKWVLEKRSDLVLRAEEFKILFHYLENSL